MDVCIDFLLEHNIKITEIEQIVGNDIKQLLSIRAKSQVCTWGVSHCRLCVWYAHVCDLWHKQWSHSVGNSTTPDIEFSSPT